MSFHSPTIAEIRASTERLSNPDASATVVMLGGDVAVKFGQTVTLLEAENLRFLSENSKIPVPRVFATMVEPETYSKFIVMEYFDAERLNLIWPSVTGLERLQVADRLKAVLEDLRNLDPPSYFGSLNRQAFDDGIFWTPEQNPATSGPFETEDVLNEGILKKLAENEPPSHLSLLRKLMDA